MKISYSVFTGKALLCLLPSLVCSATLPAATYYVATTGSNTNTGFSTNSAWPLLYALNNVGPSNTIVVMAGIYASNEITINTKALILKSQVKWGARLLHSPSYGIAVNSSASPSVVVDGFEIANTSQSGVAYTCQHFTVRNCWIHDCGTNLGTIASGIVSDYDQNDCTVENNLVEHNGASDQVSRDHGIYIGGGTNSTIRGNVCRYNASAGIQVYSDRGTGFTNINVYNNLCYSNHTWGVVAGGETLGKGYVNVYGNTLVFQPYALGTYVGQSFDITMNCTNNILIGTKPLLTLGTGNSLVIGDYNLINQVDSVLVGAHSIVTNNYGFVDPSAGLYWLRASSPARRKAQQVCCGNLDFFGADQSSVSDIGAFQYNALYASDTRTLDPSLVHPDFWLILRTLAPPTGLHVVPSTQ